VRYNEMILYTEITALTSHLISALAVTLDRMRFSHNTQLYFTKMVVQKNIYRV